MSGTGAVCRFQQPILKTTNREPITAHASCLADVRVQPNGNPQAGSELGSAACRRTGRWPEISRVSDPGTSIRSEEHTSELQSLMRISYAVFCLKKQNKY